MKAFAMGPARSLRQARKGRWGELTFRSQSFEFLATDGTQQSITLDGADPEAIREIARQLLTLANDLDSQTPKEVFELS